MDGKETVRQLIIGSAEIDRMKREVEAVVRMVIGFVDHDTLKRMRFKEDAFSSSECEWRLCSWDINGMSLWDAKLELGVECWLISGDHHEIKKLAYQSKSGHGTFSLKNAQAIHEGLPVFIEGVAKTFPDLTKRWQPLLDAAVAAHKRLH